MKFNLIHTMSEDAKKWRKYETDLEGFEPSTSGLEARRYILAKPQTQQILRYKVAFMDDKMNGSEITPHNNATGE